jgi:hypothetical protein
MTDATNPTAQPTTENGSSGVREPEPEMRFGDDEGDFAVAWKALPPEREFIATPYDPPIKSLVQEMRE